MGEVFEGSGAFERDTAGADVAVGRDDFGFGGARVGKEVAEVGVGVGPVHFDSELAVVGHDGLSAGLHVAAWLWRLLVLLIF